MQITLYGDNDEPIGVHTRSIVPWGMLKRAIRLAGKLEKDQMTEELIDELAGLVVDVFGNKFTVADLNNGAEMSEMLTVLNAIIGKAQAVMPVSEANPTKPG